MLYERKEKNMATSSKVRNYNVDFWRIFLTLCFVAVHIIIVMPPALGGKPNLSVFGGWAPMMIPFFIFTGYFLMHAVRRAKTRNPEATALQASWKYLRSRLVYFFPALLIGQIFGFLVNNIFEHTPITEWPLRFLDSLWEICGFQLTGLGMGNSYVGYGGGANNSWKMLNGPLWYISGILILGWVIFFLLYKYEEFCIGILFPIGWLLTNGAYNVNGWNPAWGTYLFQSERFPVGVLNDKLVHMFFGFGLGAVFFCIIEAIDKKYPDGFSKKGTIALTILNGFLNIFMMVHMFVGFKLSLATSWGLLAVMCFLILLNRDKYNEYFSKIFGFILKPMGKIAMYIYIFHYPMIRVVYSFVGLENQLACFLIVVAISIVVSVGYYQLYTRKIDPYFNPKKPAPAENAKA